MENQNSEFTEAMPIWLVELKRLAKEARLPKQRMARAQ